MSLTEFHEADDSCAPFPHRVLILPAREVKVRSGRKSRLVTYLEQRFILCAYCDHWIQVRIPCDCPNLCHSLQEVLDNLTPEAVN